MASLTRKQLLAWLDLQCYPDSYKTGRRAASFDPYRTWSFEECYQKACEYLNWSWKDASTTRNPNAYQMYDADRTVAKLLRAMFKGFVAHGEPLEVPAFPSLLSLSQQEKIRVLGRYVAELEQKFGI